MSTRHNRTLTLACICCFWKESFSSTHLPGQQGYLTESRADNGNVKGLPTYLPLASLLLTILAPNACTSISAGPSWLLILEKGAHISPSHLKQNKLNAQPTHIAGGETRTLIITCPLVFSIKITFSSVSLIQRLRILPIAIIQHLKNKNNLEQTNTYLIVMGCKPWEAYLKANARNLCLTQDLKFLGCYGRNQSKLECRVFKC